MDWDSENFEPNPVTSNISNQWDGEDEEENVKDNWEDDDEVKKEEPQKRQSLQSKKPKSRLEEKIEERERREQEQRARQKNLFSEEIDTTDMTPEQIQAEKLRRQKLQEDSDFDLAKDILGANDDDVAIDKYHPTTKEEFTSFKDALTKKVLQYKKSEHFNTFMEEFIRDISANLSSTELKQLKIIMDNMFNEKAKIEKEKSKKSKGKNKAKLRVEGNDMMYDEYSAYTIDEYDDFI